MNLIEKLIEKLYLRIPDNKVYTDSMTGCRSRYYYDTVVRKNYIGQELTVIYIDINGLKSVNDRLGHQKGTELIQQVVEFLSSVYPLSTICRIGGDEFLILMHPSESPEKLLASCSFSYGICKKEKFEDISSVVRKSESEMYGMKRRYHEYHDKISKEESGINEEN